MSAAPVVLYEKREPGVAWITLNRPQVLNAINLAMRDDLWTFLQAARLDPDLRVLGFRGAASRAFSAGADISEFGTAASVLEARLARQERDLWALLAELPLITIAAMHGYCYGAGLELALFCDLRVAAADTRCALPEVGLGYIPSAGGTQTLPRLMPPGVALGLVLSGDPLSAAQALAWGLVYRVVPAGDLDATVADLAQSLAARDPATLRALKEAVRRGIDLPLPAALARDALQATLLRRRGLDTISPTP